MPTQIWTRQGQSDGAMFPLGRALSGLEDYKQKARDHKTWLCVFAVLLLCGCADVSWAQTYTVLADFDKATGWFSYPQTLVEGFDGNFYGTTGSGGSQGGTAGTVFKLSGSTLTAVYDFCAEAHCADGGHGAYGLTVNTDGSFYGANTAGGAYHQGTIFKLTPDGGLTTLYSFCVSTNCRDGRFPLSVVLGMDGNFYGTTRYGGGNSDSGTVFKMTPTGTLTKLYSFCGLSKCADGLEPNALILAAKGNFYGTTAGGGLHGHGTIFKITSSGVLTTLYNFCTKESGAQCLDGEAANPLVQGADGNFYGTTSSGGTNVYGTAFKMTPSGSLTTLYNFCSQANCADGGRPDTALIQATDGKLYGTTTIFGTSGCSSDGGTAFQLTTQGALTTLYLFCSQSNDIDGMSPNGLLQSTDGNFYGTTNFGGALGDGVAFQLSTGLGPFVKAIPGFGKVGSTITILGTNLSGATSVKFDGVASSFTVVSNSEIQATIPSGAKTGKIEVITPSGGLFSNVPFRVRP